MERNMPVCGPDGKAKVKEALIRDLLRWGEGQHATIGSAQSRVNSRRRRLAPTGEDIFRTPTGQRRWTTTVFTGRVSECGQQEASTSQVALSLLHLDGKSGDEVESPLVAERPPEPKLDPNDRQAQIQWAVKCLRCSTCERLRRPSSHRPSSIPTDGERFNDELFVDVCDLVDVRANRYGWLVAVDQHWIRWAYLQGSLEGRGESGIVHHSNVSQVRVVLVR